jgi:hypothetical protein
MTTSSTSSTRPNKFPGKPGDLHFEDNIYGNPYGGVRWPCTLTQKLALEALRGVIFPNLPTAQKHGYFGSQNPVTGDVIIGMRDATGQGRSFRVDRRGRVERAWP